MIARPRRGPDRTTPDFNGGTTMIRTISLWVARASGTLAALALLLAPLTMSRAQETSHAGGDAQANSDLAIRQVVAGFSDGWNRHDAAAMCASLSDDVQWTNWRGEALHTRQDVQDQHAMLFADLYKSTHRTDEVKSVTYLRPDLAAVDDYWTMTGAKNRDGSDWPYRLKLASVHSSWRCRRNLWVIIVSHTADFNAKIPAKISCGQLANGDSSGLEPTRLSLPLALGLTAR